MRTKTTALLLATLAIFGATVAIAAAEEVSTEAYVAQVEPICHQNAMANEKILKNVKDRRQEGQAEDRRPSPSPRQRVPWARPTANCRASPSPPPPRRP